MSGKNGRNGKNGNNGVYSDVIRGDIHLLTQDFTYFIGSKGCFVTERCQAVLFSSHYEASEFARLQGFEYLGVADEEITVR